MRFGSGPDPADLISLPWSLPLEEWPPDALVSLPRGISRHVVRFVSMGGVVYAIKEINHHLADREFALLTELRRRQVPVVQPVGVVADRKTEAGDELDAVLVTKHLRFSLPYRALFARRMDPDLEGKLLDALAELLVRLHLAGFAWGDCSLSNTLFRRDAGALAAYLVDAETGELHDELSEGQRVYDIQLAQTNLGGELMDLEAAGLLPDHVDPVDAALSVCDKYDALWSALTSAQTVDVGEWGLVEERLRRLNLLGYDAAQIEVSEVDGNPRVLVQTQVVEAGHHRRRLRQLTGLSVQENQARRILNDLDAYRARAVMPGTDIDEDTVARHWLADVFEPAMDAVPLELRGKLDEPELFHEIIEHRWYLSEAAGHEVSIDDAAQSYVATVLPERPDEVTVIDSPDVPD